MADSQWRDELGPMLRTLQIVVGALIAGTVGFLVVVLVVFTTEDRGDAAPVITYVAVAFAVTTLIARIVTPGIIIARGRRAIARGTWRLTQGSAAPPARIAELLERTGDAGKLGILFNISTIVAAALLEGAAFFAIVAYMMEHSVLSLIVAVVLIFGLATHVPTRSRLIHWIEDQLAQLQQERHLGG